MSRKDCKILLLLVSVCFTAVTYEALKYGHWLGAFTYFALVLYWAFCVFKIDRKK